MSCKICLWCLCLPQVCWWSLRSYFKNPRFCAVSQLPSSPNDAAMVFHDSRLDFDTLDPELLAQPSSTTCWKPARFQKPCGSSLLSGSSTCLTVLTTLTFQPVPLLMDAICSMTINPFIGPLEKQLPASRTAPGWTRLDVTCMCLSSRCTVCSLFGPSQGCRPMVQRNVCFKDHSRQLAEVCCNVLSATCKAMEAVLEFGPSGR